MKGFKVFIVVFMVCIVTVCAISSISKGSIYFPVITLVLNSFWSGLYIQSLYERNEIEDNL